MKTVKIYTDGACKRDKVGGWGATLLYEKETIEKFGGEKSTTNNRMELTAVIEGLSAIEHPHEINIYLDSQYVKNGITTWIKGWKRNGWKTATKEPVKNSELWKRLDDLANTRGHNITWIWVKGHSGNPGNERADQLANNGVDTIRGVK